MMKTLGNLVLVIWSKFKIFSNLAAENLALRHQLLVMKRTNKRPKIRWADRLFLGLYDKAIEYYTQALAIFEDIKSPSADWVRQKISELKAEKDS